jgi:hypothetical protein
MPLNHTFKQTLSRQNTIKHLRYYAENLVDHSTRLRQCPPLTYGKCESIVRCLHLLPNGCERWGNARYGMCSLLEEGLVVPRGEGGKERGRREGTIEVEGG